jgi:hypothetical protein
MGCPKVKGYLWINITRQGVIMDKEDWWDWWDDELDDDVWFEEEQEPEEKGEPVLSDEFSIVCLRCHSKASVEETHFQAQHGASESYGAYDTISITCPTCKNTFVIFEG